MSPSQSAPAERLYAHGWPTSFVLLAVAILSVNPLLQAQFTSGSDKSDGALTFAGQTGTVLFDPVALQLHGNGDALCVFNFTTITIPAGVTVKLSANKVNCPVYWLADGDVDISGTLDLSGGSGAINTLDTALRIPAVPGSGGFSGGSGR